MGHPDVAPNAVLPQEGTMQKLPSELSFRMGGLGREICVPMARSTVQLFNMQGRQVASLQASQPGWYTLPGGALLRGACLVRLNTPAGSVSRVVALVK